MQIESIFVKYPTPLLPIGCYFFWLISDLSDKHLPVAGGQKRLFQGFIIPLQGLYKGIVIPHSLQLF